MEGRKSPGQGFIRARKEVPESAKSGKKLSLTEALSDTWMWVYLISYIVVALVLLFIYMYKFKASDYTGVVGPSWVPNKYISAIILFGVYFLYFFGSYRLDRVSAGWRLWAFKITYFATLAFQLVLGWIAFYSKKFQWCFWLSFIPPIIVAVQMFFAWFIDKISFFLLLPALILQILMIFVYWKYWKLN